MPWVTSANIACGGHAGDASTMRAAVELALRHGVAIGAHPGFPDRAHFGRRAVAATPALVEGWVLEQTQALQRVAAALGARVTHLKPHGALYHQAAREGAIARAVAAAVLAADPALWLVGLAGSVLIETGRACGLRVAGEAFADRTYQADGSLTPRTEPGALIEDEAASVAQVLRFVRTGTVVATDGQAVAVRADTICLHGDGAQAVRFARRLRSELAAANVRVEGLSL